MNEKKQLDKDIVIKNKKKAIWTLNNLLESYIKDDSEKHLKKANLISYWIKDFSKYIEYEESFVPHKLIRYKRGSVIRLNFGFSVGNELGGLHYAVVIDNDNKKNSGVITVIPLSSTDGKTVHDRNVDLGTELFEKIRHSHSELLYEAQTKLNQLNETVKILTDTKEVIQGLKDHPSNISPDVIHKLENTLAHHAQLQLEENNIEETIEKLNKYGHEIERMKIGSMALINQITTVSKQRIYTPKRSEDFLYGISLSGSAMEKINSKIQELFIHK